MNKLQQLRIRQGLSMKEVASALSMPYTTYVNYEKGAREPGSETLIRFADFYGVSVDYLIGRETVPETDTLTEKDLRDIARDLEGLMERLDTAGDLMFDGDPISDETRDSIRNALQLGLELAKLKNKSRFTPHKYRKDEP